MQREVPRLSSIPEQLSQQQFWEQIGHLEHERIEFKQGTSRLDEVIPAMAMTDGGLIVLGVADDRSIRGCPLEQGTLDRVTRASGSCGVEVQLREVRVGSKRLTLVAVPEVRGRIVTTTDGRLLRRVGGANQPLVSDALARFVRERVGHSAETDSVPFVDLRRLDLRLVNRALQADGRPSANRSALMRALGDLGVTVTPAPPAEAIATKAAMLLFSPDPHHVIAGAVVQAVRREGIGPGPGPTRARQEIVGPIPKVVDAVISFINEQTTSHEAIVGRHRERIAEYPEAVLREALLNALAHRDYGLEGATVDVTIWDDRLEIQSPGSLPGHITVDNMRHEHYSRNRAIMRVLKLLGLVEEYGDGVDRMYREMDARLLEPPVFVAAPSSVTVTLRNRSLATVEDQAWLALLGHLELSALERRMLILARHEDGVTPRRLRELLPGIDVDLLLVGAVTKGLLVRVGERGGSRYVLSDEIVMRAGAGGVEARTRQRQHLLEEMQRAGSLSTAEGATILDEDSAVVRDLLNDLVRARLAVARGKTRARRYYPG